MYITICVIAYNEEQYIGDILDDIKNQDYNHNDMELLLVDSASTDKTPEIMRDFMENNSTNFRKISIVKNPKKTLPCGWNVALSCYEGEAILKVDAHAKLPTSFVSKNVRDLESGEMVVGGRRPTIIKDDSNWQDTLLLAENSMFGSSIASFRNNPGKTYVKSIFHGAYRREVFDKVGGFNEQLTRTEDNEIHYRIRNAGFNILFDPDIVSYQYIRSSLAKMLKQKHANGFWIGKTLRLVPGCLSLYHFVPFAFVMAIIVTTILCLFTDWMAIGILTGIMWGLYCLLAIAMAILAVITAPRDKRHVSAVLLPVLFFLLHVSYGLGTLRSFFMKK